MRIFKKIKTWWWYNHKGPKEAVYDNPMNKYIPDEIFENDEVSIIISLLKYKPEKDVYTVNIRPYYQKYFC